jgi:hypothetical protein
MAEGACGIAAGAAARLHRSCHPGGCLHARRHGRCRWCDRRSGTLFAHPAPWIAALDAASYDAAWRTLSKQLNATDGAVLQAAMFGAPQAGIPAWAGYSIGYRLVSERMARAPKLDLKAMTAAPATEFIPAPSSE